VVAVGYARAGRRNPRAAANAGGHRLAERVSPRVAAQANGEDQCTMAHARLACSEHARPPPEARAPQLLRRPISRPGAVPHPTMPPTRWDVSCGRSSRRSAKSWLEVPHALTALRDPPHRLQRPASQDHHGYADDAVRERREQADVDGQGPAPEEG